MEKGFTLDTSGETQVIEMREPTPEEMALFAEQTLAVSLNRSAAMRRALWPELTVARVFLDAFEREAKAAQDAQGGPLAG